MMKNNTALILGATGGIGGEVMRQLLGKGWHVRALIRRPGMVKNAENVSTHGLSSEHLGEHLSKHTGQVDWIEGDAMNQADVTRAADGCSVIVHGVNPPGYRKWAEWVLPMIDNTIAAARVHGATIVLPGTIYNYGPDAFPILEESSPEHPRTRKGAIRAALEQRLKRASQEGVRVLIVRAGDFFGPDAKSNWFSQGLVKPNKPVRTIHYPGRQGIGHQWSYLPDVARTMVALLERRDSLDAFACFHTEGHWDEDGTLMVNAIRRIVAQRTGTTPRVAGFPWWLVTLASPFMTTFRELREMRYLWNEPLRMRNAQLVKTLGHEPHTPLDRAVEATLVGMRNLG